ncbi:hypothetical protein FY034_18150 (plasmid) [Trichlorobacter lovleyi]|uniref:hypothetical protein n=1 Tax=Trichlorobacter lovleyi TaxID=313985 RepID=UPI00223F0B65|nr:hypothetical protein [Trichlorobacter lovleyi]QOX80924.1 hypothetical protein FY034_18150 [Trichlorobacter lovleyi]
MRIRMMHASAVFMLLFLGTFPFIASAETPQDSATNIYNKNIKPQYGANTALKANVSDPMISGGSLKTIDGKKSFTVDSFKGSDKATLKVVAVPNPATGDVASVTIQQDLDNDGTLDISNTFPTLAESGKMISGVCSNGYIACSPGTYSGCKYSMWSADSNGAVGVTPVATLSELANCYCYNNYCARFNNTTMLNLDSIVGDLGSGILTAFLSKRPEYAISSATSGLGSISYYGTKLDRPNYNTAKNVPKPVVYSSATPDVVMTYSDNPGAVDSIGQSEITSQQTQPNSMFNIIQGVAANQPGSQTKTCEVKRNAQITLKDKTFGTDQLIDSTASDHYVCLTYNTLGETGLNVHLQTNNYNGGCCTPGCGGLEQSRDLGQLKFVPDGPDYANGFTLSKIDMIYKLVGDGCSNVNQSVSWIPGMTTFPMVAQTQCAGAGVQHFVITTSAVFTYTAQTWDESITDGCAAIAADSNCKVKDEQWDDREVVFNYMPTGFNLSQVCKTISGQIRDTQMCRDWWLKKRTYTCKTGQAPYTFDESRFKEARTTVAHNGDTMTYTDGGIGKTYVIGVEPAEMPCEKACKTKMVTADTTVAHFDVSSDARTAPAAAGAGYRYFWKNCLIDNDGKDYCPVDPGETVVDACVCANTKDFGEAMAGLGVINTLKNDNICSSVPASNY